MATLPIPGSDLALLAVSSNLTNDSGWMVYRNDASPRTFDLRFDLGSINVFGGRWGIPLVIPVQPGFIYSNVAISHDLTNDDRGVCVVMIHSKQDR